MRVIAGSFGGLTLRAPKGSETRPTSDRVREALFSMLTALEPPVLADARVLDLFAGSGALAIEALSRGAASAVFVDNAAPAVEAIRANLATVKRTGEVVRRPALAYLHAAVSLGHEYDLVFVDPPYRMASELGKTLSAALPAVLSAGARVVTESDRRDPLALQLPLIRERRYGDTLITIHDAR
jgi:16S rRNA (guanine966-N2)-methyltransferase